MTKSFFLIALAACLVFQPLHTAAQGGMVGKASQQALIQTACGATSARELCSATLTAVANNPYLDPTAITITAVQAASKTAVATFDIINMSLTVDVQLLSDQGVRQSLSICAKEYKTVIDSMDKATTALTQKADTSQVPALLNTAMGSVTKCDSSGIKMTNKVVQLAAKNIDCTKLIKNALDIYQVFANYITNPQHDPNKGPVPMPNVGGGGAIAGGVANMVKGGIEGGGPLGGGGNIPNLLKGGGAGAPNAGPLGGGVGAGLFKGGAGDAPAKSLRRR